jgi:hypothetical protein
MTHNPTPGELAYNEDLRRQPIYLHTGEPRPTWAQLDAWVKQSWERNPTPREWKQAVPCA